MSWGRYLLVLSGGPLIIARLPEPEPRWRDILKACTGLMREHGLKQKDISGIEAHDAGARPGEGEAFRQKLEVAFSGGPGVEKFWLYEWRDSSFVMVRRGTALSLAMPLRHRFGIRVW
jgi:hypothetical protein